MNKPFHCIGIALGLVAAGRADAHITLSQAQAPSGGYYTAYFRVSHGCEGSATTALRVEIPQAIIGAKPQPKPGWTLRIEHAPLAAPVAGEGGRKLTQRVSAVTWTGGPLPDEQWDEFGLSAKLPATTGPLYFPSVQTCERGQVRWTDIAPPGQAPHSVPHPAPMVVLQSADPGAAAMSMSMGH